MSFFFLFFHHTRYEPDILILIVGCLRYQTSVLVLYHQVCRSKRQIRTWKLIPSAYICRVPRTAVFHLQSSKQCNTAGGSYRRPENKNLLFWQRKARGFYYCDVSTLNTWMGSIAYQRQDLKSATTFFAEHTNALFVPGIWYWFTCACCCAAARSLISVYHDGQEYSTQHPLVIYTQICCNFIVTLVSNIKSLIIQSTYLNVDYIHGGSGWIHEVALLLILLILMIARCEACGSVASAFETLKRTPF